MTRETKIGMTVASSFLCLVGGVVGTKFIKGEIPKSLEGVTQTVAEITPTEPTPAKASGEPGPVPAAYLSSTPLPPVTNPSPFPTVGGNIPEAPKLPAPPEQNTITLPSLPNPVAGVMEVGQDAARKLEEAIRKDKEALQNAADQARANLNDKGSQTRNDLIGKANDVLSGLNRGAAQLNNDLKDKANNLVNSLPPIPSAPSLPRPPANGEIAPLPVPPLEFAQNNPVVVKPSSGSAPPPPPGGAGSLSVPSTGIVSGPNSRPNTPPPPNSPSNPIPVRPNESSLPPPPAGNFTNLPPMAPPGIPEPATNLPGVPKATNTPPPPAPPGAGPGNAPPNNPGFTPPPPPMPGALRDSLPSVTSVPPPAATSPLPPMVPPPASSPPPPRSNDPIPGGNVPMIPAGPSSPPPFSGATPTPRIPGPETNNTTSLPPVTNPPTVVKSDTLDRYICQGNENYALISARKFGSDRYARALEQYNRDLPGAPDNVRANPAQLRPGTTVWLPSLNFLTERYGQLVTATQVPTVPGAGVPGVVTAPPPMTNTTPLPAVSSGRSLGSDLGISSPTPLPPVTAAPLSQPSSTPAAGVTSFRVPAGGMLISQIAERQLGSPLRWIDIYRLNPGIDPAQPLREGTEIRIPMK